jgi:hypothetical protein
MSLIRDTRDDRAPRGGARTAVPRSARGALVAFALATLGAFVAPACGARSGLDVPPPPPPVPECFVDADCPGIEDRCKPVTCVLFASDDDDDDAGAQGGGSDAGAAPRGGSCALLEPVDCDDNDPCTLDECQPETGLCLYDVATHDNDGDGFKAPRPGTKPTDPDSCGTDCDDTSEKAFPGNQEICDGVDNDCNGVVDDNAAFIPVGAEAIRVSPDGVTPASPGGLAWSGTSFAAIYTATTQGFDMYSSMRDATGAKLLPTPDPLVTFQNADSAGGPIIWVGDRYGLLWQDRRDGDYEVYFTLLDESGAKVLPDTRVTFAFDFSVNVALAYNGTEFIAAWQDRRDGIFELYGQRISVDGALIGSNIKLTASSIFESESPSIAAGTTSVGVAWGVGDASNHRIHFQTHAVDLTTPGSEVVVITDGTTEAVYPTVVWNQDRYIIAWYDKSATPKGIWGAAVGEDGTILVPATPLTNPGPFHSRYPNLKPLGDRLLLVYSDDRDQNDGYELYARMINKDLGPIGQENRLTFAASNSTYPVAAFGADGDVGVLFRDEREGGLDHVYLTRLGCVTPPNP